MKKPTLSVTSLIVTALLSIVLMSRVFGVFPVAGQSIDISTIYEKTYESDKATTNGTTEQDSSDNLQEKDTHTTGTDESASNSGNKAPLYYTRKPSETRSFYQPGPQYSDTPPPDLKDNTTPDQAETGTSKSPTTNEQLASGYVLTGAGLHGETVVTHYATAQGASSSSGTRQGKKSGKKNGNPATKDSLTFTPQSETTHIATEKEFVVPGDYFTATAESKDITTKKATAHLQADTTIKRLTADSLDEATIGFYQKKIDNISLPPHKRYITLQWGIPDTHLTFSRPVKVQIPVPDSLNDTIVDLHTHHYGENGLSTKGLTNSPNSTCLADGDSSQVTNSFPVQQGMVTFYTCSASTFVVTYTGGANFNNFVDNGTLDKTITVTSGESSSGATITDLNLIVDFQPIDSEDPTNFGTTNAYADEVSMSLTSPDGNTTVNALVVDTYTDQSYSPRVTVTFDDAASSLPSGLPATGTFLPNESLSTFNGISAVGDRTFTIGDNTSMDGVILYSASLEITENNTVCGDGTVTSPETCDDGNSTSGDGCSSSCTVESGYTCSGEPSSCSSCIEGLLIGKDIETITGGWRSISLSSFRSEPYSSPPIVLTTPKTENNGNNYPLPRIQNITNTGFEMSICVDAGDPTCDATATGEDIAVIVVDTTKAACTDHFQAGTSSVATDGSVTSFSFSGTFTNTPYVFARPQTASQAGSIAAATWVEDSITTAGAGIVGCVHQNGNNGNVNNCTSGEPNETAGRIAFDPNLFTFSGLQFGVEEIQHSTWTSISFSPTYANPPTIVTDAHGLNSHSPLYPWSRNIQTGTAQIRYCEQDGPGECDNHPKEDVYWMSLQDITYSAVCGNGIIESGEACDDGNTTSGDGCSSTCTIEPVCGNGTIEGPEACDDNNTSNGDGCSSSCTVESGYTCSGEPSSCTLPPTLNCSPTLYFDDDSSGEYSSGDTQFTGYAGSGATGRNTYFDVGSGATGTLYIDFARYDDGISLDINGTHIFDEGQPDFFSPTINQPWTTNSNGLPRLRIVLESGSVSFFASLDTTSTSLTGVTPTAGATNPSFLDNSQNSLDLTITNDSGPYGSDFSTTWSCSDSTTGNQTESVTIAGAQTFSITGLISKEFPQTITGQLNDYLRVIDSKGADSGYYTTLAITDLSGNNQNISNANIERKADSVDLISGNSNANVVLASGFSSYSPATSTVTFLKRDSGTNTGKTGTYGAKPDLRITIPPYTQPDTYLGTITFTLYEN